MKSTLRHYKNCEGPSPKYDPNQCSSHIMGILIGCLLKFLTPYFIKVEFFDQNNLFA